MTLEDLSRPGPRILLLEDGISHRRRIQSHPRLLRGDGEVQPLTLQLDAVIPHLGIQLLGGVGGSIQRDVNGRDVGIREEMRGEEKDSAQVDDGNHSATAPKAIPSFRATERFEVDL